MTVLQSILFICILASVAFAASGDMGGTTQNGSSDHPWLIEDIDDFDEFTSDENYWDGHTRLDCDLDLDPNLPGRQIYTQAPIGGGILTETGFDGTEFSGSFNGNGHVIRNLTVNGTYLCGLFGIIIAGSEVKDLGMEDVSITGEFCVGGLAGVNLDSIITNSYSTGVISGDSSVGGLVGQNSDSITSSYSTVTVTGDNSVGGLVGYNNGSIANSYSTGMVDGSVNNVGGLVGRNDRTVSNSYSTGAVSGSGSNIGGLVGNCYSGIIKSSFWDIQTSGMAVGYNLHSSYTWSIRNVVGKTTAKMQTMSTFVDAGWDFVSDWSFGDDSIMDGYPYLAWQGLSGLGTKESPYLIKNFSDFEVFTSDENYWDDHTRLDCDLDLDPSLPGRQIYNHAPIGTSRGITDGSKLNNDDPFSGIFDGNDHIIRNLTIDGGSYCGLFGELTVGVDVRNLGVIDYNIIGGDFLGGIAGMSDGSITNCYSTGTIEGRSQHIGGLVGYLGGWPSDNESGSIIDSYSIVSVSGDRCVGGLVGGTVGLIKSCYSDGAVSGSDNCFGGLAGYNAGSVIESYSKAEVNGDNYVGGLVGLNYDSIISSYSTGAVTGNGFMVFIGGLVGSNEEGSITSSYSAGKVTGNGFAGGLVGLNKEGSITNSYSIGMVTGTGDYIGGLVGDNYNGSVTGSFWDVDTSEMSTSDGGVGLPTDAMNFLPIFVSAGWDFAAVWVMLDYPRLAWQVLSGAGTEQNPYLIENFADFQKFCSNSAYWDYYTRLACDLDLDPSLPGRVIYTKAPIAGDDSDSDTTTIMFSGIFDGNGHVIRNLTVNGTDDCALFGIIAFDAEVKDLGIEDVSIIGSGHGLGAVASVNWESIITNCYSTGTITGDANVGGLVGQNSGSITSSYSTVTVSSDSSAGGLAGSNYNGSITDSYSRGAINCSGDRIGGIAGYNDLGVISRSYSTGEITGDYYVGGVAGYNNTGIITSSYSTGNVSGDINVGGLVGSNTGGSLTSSYSTGAVSARGHSGGLVGFNDLGNIRKCYSIGNVTGGIGTGGLVGVNLDGGNITNSFWDIESSGLSYSAGGTDKTTVEMKSLSTFLDGSWDFVGESVNGTEDIWRLCVDGSRYPRLDWEFVRQGDFICGDGVDADDLAVLASDWLVEGPSRTDANFDGKVDMQDLLLVAENWLIVNR